MDILITAIIIILAFIGLRFLMQKKAQRAKGKEVDISIFDDKIKKLLKSEKSILYFYTPTCGACRSQTPIIDKLESETNAVGKIDLSINRNAAKEFGIMGTPSTAIMSGNKIAEIFIGLKQENFLKKKFDEV
ncbi:MAG: thioredoxin family protein [Chlorobi bacterium]|nr:thioredoxin family protein [Chlorobiota bacterium]